MYQDTHPKEAKHLASKVKIFMYLIKNTCFSYGFIIRLISKLKGKYETTLFMDRRL